jgi:hypothetical protein
MSGGDFGLRIAECGLKAADKRFGLPIRNPKSEIRNGKALARQHSLRAFVRSW